MKECVKRLWNTLKTSFLNDKLQRLCKSHHLQCITSSKDSEKLEKSLHKGQCRRPLLDARGVRALRRHSISHRHDSVIDITKWAQEYFQKPLPVNTIRRAICRCQLKLYHAKRWTWSRSVTVSCGPRLIFSCGLFQCVKVFYGQTSPNLTFFLEIMDAVSSGLMRREMRKETFQAFSSKVIISNGMRGHMCTRGSLHVLEGTMNAIRYIKNLDQHMLLSRWHLFQGRPNPNPNNAKPLTAAITTAWLRSRRVPAVQIFHL